MTSLSESAVGRPPSGDGSSDVVHEDDGTLDTAPSKAAAAAPGTVGVADMSQQARIHEETSWGNTIAGVMGNVLEWYDFALFGFFADIIGEVFFPPTPGIDNGEENLLKSFTIFGSAFLMRPVGGLLIGAYGDKHGRKEALTKSLFLMAIPTTLMGCLPTYEQAGIFSTILLCLCRLVQGISVGGQLPASLVYTVEQRPKENWGYYGSLPMVAANLGTLSGNLVGALMREVLTQEQLVAWGWRIPFASGFLIAFVAMYIHKYGSDRDALTPLSDDIVYKNEHRPIKETFKRSNLVALVSTAFTSTLWGAGFYVSFIWLAVYMEELKEPPIPHAFWINAVSLFLGMTCVLPIAGAISDRVGRVPMMTCAGLLLTITGPFFMLLISKQDNGWTAFVAQLCIALMLSFYGGGLCAWLVENFSPEVRMTSASFGYDMSHAIAGGFAPAIATALYAKSGNVVTSGGMVYIVYGTVSIMGIYLNYFYGTKIDKESDTGESSSGGTVRAVVGKSTRSASSSELHETTRTETSVESTTDAKIV